MLKRKLLFGLFGLAAVTVLIVFYLSRPVTDAGQKYGVTFSSKQAQELDLDTEETYLAVLDELGVRRLRLSAYWDVIEPGPGAYDFTELDWQISEAANRQAEVVLTIGRKLPRWPECFMPDWARALSSAEQEEALHKMLRTVVNRYDSNPAVIMWQLENEPFVGWFGHCWEPDIGVLTRERATVKNFSQKPILVTDSGELSLWHQAADFGDYFGTTLYRATWNPWFGYSYSIWPAGFYRLKARLNGLDPTKVIISELQAEPWTPGLPLLYTPPGEQIKTMDLAKLQEALAFTKKTGSREVYLWGVEWWYWLKLNGQPEIWDFSKNLFK